MTTSPHPVTVKAASNVHLAVARVERQHALIEEMRCSSPRRVTAAALAMRTGVSTRTVERDVAALQQAGVPISVRSGPHGGYSMAASSRPEPVHLTATELGALVASLAAVGPYTSAAAQSAMSKLLAALDPRP